MPDRDRSSALPLHQALVLGLLQGPTELLPISSSAHTSLVPWLAGWRYCELDGERRKSFEVALHAGAGAALALHMRTELLHDAARIDARRTAMIALSVLPPALAGYALGGVVERRLGGPRSIAAGLLGGAAGMVAVEAGATRLQRARAREDAGVVDGLALGFAQMTALIPGVSRSGATMTAARARGFSREAAQALSWHAGLPVIFGASALRGARASRAGLARGERLVLALGGASAFASTLASAALMRRRELGASSIAACSLYRGLLAAAVIRRVRRSQ